MNPELLAASVLHILRGMTWHPELSRESWDPSDGKLRITFEPHPPDLRCCIGNGGAVIKGLQHVTAVIGKLNGYRASIHLAQNFNGLAEPENHEFEQCQGFDDREIFRITSGLLASAFQREVKTSRRRVNDLLELKTDVQTEGEKVIVQALNEPLYAYGFRQGCIIKLSATNHK